MLEAVREIGLNQIAEAMPEWFDDEQKRNMFFKRLDVLKSKNEK